MLLLFLPFTLICPRRLSRGIKLSLGTKCTLNDCMFENNLFTLKRENRDVFKLPLTMSNGKLN